MLILQKNDFLQCIDNNGVWFNNQVPARRKGEIFPVCRLSFNLWLSWKRLEQRQGNLFYRLGVFVVLIKVIIWPSTKNRVLSSPRVSKWAFSDISGFLNNPFTRFLGREINFLENQVNFHHSIESGLCIPEVFQLKRTRHFFSQVFTTILKCLHKVGLSPCSFWIV